MAAGWKKLGIHRRILVNLRDGSAVDGILWRELRDLVVLKDARLHESGVEDQSLDGEVVIERAQIRFAQVFER
ncbi:MAG: hypothetical protein WAS05_00755 [Candidatus Nanopelagicales bacterium]